MHADAHLTLAGRMLILAIIAGCGLLPLIEYPTIATVGLCLGFGLLCGGAAVIVRVGGVLHLGISMYFGLAAYAFVYLRLQNCSFYVACLLATAGVVLLSWPLTYILHVVRHSPSVQAILSLALCMLVRQGILEFSDVTGGSNGLLFSNELREADPDAHGRIALWFFLLMSLLVVVLVNRTLDTSWRNLLLWMRADHIGCESYGLRVKLYRGGAHVAGAAVLSLGGCVYGEFSGIVHPDLLSPQLGLVAIAVASISAAPAVALSILLGFVYRGLLWWFSARLSDYYILIGGIMVLILSSFRSLRSKKPIHD